MSKDKCFNSKSLSHGLTVTDGLKTVFIKASGKRIFISCFVNYLSLSGGEMDGPYGTMILVRQNGRLVEEKKFDDKRLDKSAFRLHGGLISIEGYNFPGRPGKSLSTSSSVVVKRSLFIGFFD